MDRVTTGNHRFRTICAKSRTVSTRRCSGQGVSQRDSPRVPHIRHLRNAGAPRSSARPRGSRRSWAPEGSSTRAPAPAGEGSTQSVPLRGFSLVVESQRPDDSSFPFWKACGVWKRHKYNSSCNETPCLRTLALLSSNNHLHLFYLIL